MTTTTNLYLDGRFAPVRDEVTLTDLPVTGTLPADLDGRYLRNGANPAGDPDPATYHWFTGDGMVHGIRLRDGRAEWYRNRWVRSPKVAWTLGESTPGGSVAGDDGYAPNTSVIGHAGRTIALVETGPLPYELDDTLGTVGPCDFDGTLTGGYTAHPQRDPATGELHAVSYSMVGDRRVQYTVLGTDGRIRRSVDIELDGNPMMHSFALTENHIVLFDLPVTRVTEDIAGYSAASEILNAGFLPYQWDPDYRARLGVLPRSGEAADVRWLDVSPCYVFHPVNAYEDGDRIVLDVIRFPSMFAASTNGPDSIPTLDRWTLDPGAGQVHEQRLDDQPQEFPRIDERRTGRPYRYGYTAGLLAGAIFKHDLVAGTTATSAFDPGDYPGEFCFVPASATSAEDDGWLMGLVHRSATDLSDLVILDAATLTPAATVHLPVRIPLGFHGNWVPTTRN